MAISLSGGGNLLHNKEIAEDVFRRRLEQLDGVAQASVTGGLDREIQVDVNPALLESNDITLAEVSRGARPGQLLGSGRHHPAGTLPLPAPHPGRVPDGRRDRQRGGGPPGDGGRAGEGGERRTVGRGRRLRRGRRRRGRRLPAGAPERHRDGGGRLRRARGDRALQRGRVRRHPRLQGVGRQHRGRLRGGAGHPGAAEGAVPGVHRRNRLRPGHLHRRVHQQRGAGAGPGAGCWRSWSCSSSCATPATRWRSRSRSRSR